MRRILCVVVVVSLAGLASLATEPKSDLAVEVRVVDTVVSKAAWGKPSRGVARIEVTLDSFRDAQDVLLTIQRPAGRPLAVRPAWRNLRGAEVLPGSRGVVVPARGRIVTRLEVPLEGSAMHAVVVRVTARVGSEEASTEGAVFVPIGVPLAVEDGSGVANFPVKEVD
jgi:hypothetical protein